MKDKRPKYEPKEYWESKLGRNFNIRGAALGSLSTSFNMWSLKAGLRSLTERCSQRLYLSISDREHTRSFEVLDIGCGTGNYIRYWKDLGIEHLTGIDITSVSINSLRSLYPNVYFHCMDISDERAPEILGRKFDIISAMNILLHITDDEKFERALSNISQILKEGGLLLVADPIITKNYWGEPFTEDSSSKCRSLRQYLSVFGRNDLSIMDLWPTTFLMSNPIDTGSKAAFQLLSMFWRFTVIMARKEKSGAILGRLLYNVELVLPRILKNGPTGKFLVALKETKSCAKDG